MEISKTQQRPDDVPVVVDSTKNLNGFSMTRCNYLSVECHEPRPGWQLGIGPERFPFLMLQLTGIIQRPIGGIKFGDPDEIEDLFQLIEEEAGLFIKIEDLWLPNDLFDREPEPGSVYRVGTDLFSYAVQFRAGRMDQETFLMTAEEFSEGFTFSEEETSVFERWWEKERQMASDQYPKDKELVLSWEDEQ